jgi:hypothetical protein
MSYCQFFLLQFVVATIGGIIGSILMGRYLKWRKKNNEDSTKGY